ncbi:hypothetical protein OS175_13815 [Marinicella sp. S1101]|uniref:5'-nucleotidase, lipoprotein e(P4) family n=1 Tax=Marinicella marina TaxID=2996016 RepID=UPI002260E3CD|nr:HAD family acid phosphatase [Marinicella marina]MCX7554949.1 hypothetical protein [Marinicella marina]MDJ1141559.1 HAD family acid phosphatase [Marinicella marina]
MLNKIQKNLSVAIAVLLVMGCQTNPIKQGNDSQHTNASVNMNSTLWLQTAAEFKAHALQSYLTAQRVLPAVLKDTTTSAELQQQNFAHLSPAIVLDVDETVLDNSPYQAQLVLDNKTFDINTWDQWVAKRSAKAIPGAVEFINMAADYGIKIIYLTNRECIQRSTDGDDCPQLNDTLVNLQQVGIRGISIDDLMLKQQQPNWGSEKLSRRMEVAKRHRILMLFGDDLGDFLPAVKANITPQQRADLVNNYSDYWGRHWFVFGNPTYGSWLRILPGEAEDNLRGYE